MHTKMASVMPFLLSSYFSLFPLLNSISWLGTDSFVYDLPFPLVS